MTPARSLRITFSHTSARSATLARSRPCSDRLAVLRRSLWQLTQYRSRRACGFSVDAVRGGPGWAATPADSTTDRAMAERRIRTHTASVTRLYCPNDRLPSMVRCAGQRADVLLNWRGPVGVEALDRLEPPRLPFLPFCLRPHDRLPVGREHQARAGAVELDAIAARLVDVQEERLLDGVLVRPRLDVHAVLETDVGRTQHLFTRVDRVGEVVKPAACPV